MSAVSFAPISITLTADLDAVTDGGFHLTGPETRFILCDPTITPVVVEPASAGASPPDDPHAHHTCSRPHTDEGDDPPGIERRRLTTLTTRALTAPQPLAVGRTQRVATPAQRRALALRDRGCILPGCDIPATQCQIHHLTPWTDGGHTDLPNLVSLCWAHHRQVDLGRWDIHPIESGTPGTPANHGAPFTITIRPRQQWGQRLTGA